MLMAVKPGKVLISLMSTRPVFIFHKEIAPCQTLAVQCGVGHGGVGLYLVQLGLRQMCRDDGLAHAVLVLIIIGVELCTGKDLTGTGGNSRGQKPMTAHSTSCPSTKASNTTLRSFSSARAMAAFSSS